MFVPDFQNLVCAARNQEVARFPLYEHGIHPDIMRAISGKALPPLHGGDAADLREHFRLHNLFYREMGYDTATFEVCVGHTLPGTGALGGHKEGCIKTWSDLDDYPWDEAEERYFAVAAPLFEAFGSQLPEGMRGVGGVGNGVFELAQDLVGYTALCYMRFDDPELYAAVFERAGEAIARIWARFLAEYGDLFAVCRFGDDLGFKTTTLIAPEDIREHVIPQYRRVIDLVHRSGKPFLLHSCGAIFNVMEDLIQAGINAKHSNEDQIAPFPEWVERYGSRIGNFGGVDTGVICSISEVDIPSYVRDVVERCKGHGGCAFGTGTAVANYTSPERYAQMVQTARRLRGE